MAPALTKMGRSGEGTGKGAVGFSLVSPESDMRYILYWRFRQGAH